MILERAASCYYKPKLRDPTRRAMTTPTSRSVSMVYRSFNLKSVVDVRPCW